jgi:hypothetical protein
MVIHALRMTTFADFETAAPAIAEFVQARIDATGLCFVGTTRADGWPRVSPMELFVCDGRLYVGSMPNAVKARDLQRDPRCCVIMPLADKDDLVGEAKLFCRAREVTDVAEWDAVRAAFIELRGMDPIGDPGGAHLFCLDVEGAAWQRVEGDDFRTTSWRAGEPVRERTRSGPDGQSRDL